MPSQAGRLGEGAESAILAPVSESNVDLVRRMFGAFARRDLDAMVATMCDDIEFLPVTANLTTGGVPYRGHDGMARYLDDVARVWPELRIFPDDIRGEGGAVVVVLGRVIARGGGMILDSPTGWVFTMRGGKLASGRVYASHAEALAAASALGS
jgi:ketosteroid isomerase-like protein